MKIAYVFDDSLDRPDGVQQAVLTTGEWMRSQGHDVHYIVGYTERDDIENVHSLAKSLRVKFNGNSLATPLPTSSKKIKSFLETHNFDVLHVQMPYSPFFAEKVIRFASPHTKIVGTFHILPYSRIGVVTTKQLGRVLRRSLKRFDHFVSVSKPAADFAKATFGIDSIVIPNPVRLDSFRNVASQTHVKKRIVFLGRLEERKGILELLLAYKSLVSADDRLAKKIELVVGGKGPLREKAHALAKDIEKFSTISLLGFVPESEKAGLLASADVAVFPSISGESFGIVLVEAMAAGSHIVIAGNNPGYTSVLGAKPELLIQPKNLDAFVEKLRWAIAGGSKVDELSKWLALEASQYDISEVGSRLLTLYES